jgi:hypothetical protein
MIPGSGPPDSPEPKIDNPVMLALAKKYGKTVTQITLRYIVSGNLSNLRFFFLKALAIIRYEIRIKSECK